ncbi:hypothetical protein B0A49_02772 [Cryomyces minteri]|uniref:Uncharacterized protein n=1 Tax=Cryomyces minteri TaxID=331657 RepID=A0A4U0XRH2_9PEZI|nr:hypothetical protein B0A49_02772 [Cryomyces minteri]
MHGQVSSSAIEVSGTATEKLQQNHPEGVIRVTATDTLPADQLLYHNSLRAATETAAKDLCYLPLTGNNIKEHTSASKTQPYRRPPPTINERLEQAVIFLSDQGPDNERDFEEKLARIDEHLLVRCSRQQVHDPNLYKQVKAMVRVHKARIAAAKRFEQASTQELLTQCSRQRMELHSDPTATDVSEDEIVCASPYKRDNETHARVLAKAPVTSNKCRQPLVNVGPSTAPKATSATRTPSAQPQSRRRPTPAPTAAPLSAPRQAETTSSAPTVSEPKEIWHGRASLPHFPFGETPFTEKTMSRSLKAELANESNPSSVQETKGWWAWLRTVRAGRAQMPVVKDHARRVFELPDVNPALSLEMLRVREVDEGRKKGETVGASPGGKRKAEDSLSKKTVKRVVVTFPASSLRKKAV